MPLAVFSKNKQKKKAAFVKETLISTCTDGAVFRFDARFLLKTISLLAGLLGSVLYKKVAQRQKGRLYLDEQESYVEKVV